MPNFKIKAATDVGNYFNNPFRRGSFEVETLIHLECSDTVSVCETKYTADALRNCYLIMYTR